MCSCLANKADSDRAQSHSRDGASNMDAAAKGAADSETWLPLTRLQPHGKIINWL